MDPVPVLTDRSSSDTVATSAEISRETSTSTNSSGSSFDSSRADVPQDIQEESPEEVSSDPIKLIGDKESDDSKDLEGELEERPPMPRTSSLDSLAKEKFRQWVEWDKTQLERRKAALIGKTVMGKLSPKRNTRYFVKWNIEATDTVFIGADKVEALMGANPRPGTIVTCTIKGLGPGHVQWNKQHPFSDKLEVVPMDEKHPLWRRRQREMKNKELRTRSRTQSRGSRMTRQTSRGSMMVRSRSGTYGSQNDGQRRSIDKPQMGRRRSLREGPPMGIRRSLGDNIALARERVPSFEILRSAPRTSGDISRQSSGDLSENKPRRKSYAQQNWTLGPNSAFAHVVSG